MENENQHTYDNGFHPKEVVLKKNYKFYNHSWYFRIAARITIWFTRFWLVFAKLIMGVRIKGKKNKYKAHGMIIISNHIHPLDAFFLAASFYFSKVYVTMLQSNLGFGIVSKYMRLAAAVPIPTDRHLLRKFNEGTAETLKKKKQNILFYPEAALMPYCDHIRNFLPGAFHYAIVNEVPILPCCYTFHKPKGIYKLFRRKKPVIRLNVLEPYYPKYTDNRNETIKQTTEEVHKIISDFFIQNSDYYYDNNKKTS